MKSTQILTAAFVAVAATGFASSAMAHKEKAVHTHCTVNGKGVEAKGKDDAEQKKTCLKTSGASWDEAKGYAIGGPALTDDGRMPAASSNKK